MNNNHHVMNGGSANNGGFASTTTHQRTRKGKLHKLQRKRSKWERQLDPRHLLCGTTSSTSTFARMLMISFIVLLSIWLCLQIVAFSQLSDLNNNNMNRPMFASEDATGKNFWDRLKQKARQVEKNAIRGGIEVSKALQMGPSKFIDESSTKTKTPPIIDMRELAKTLPFDNPDGGAWKQGWDLQPVKPSRKNPVKIFVVPHTHCDPGWTRTYDQYYHSETKQILNTIIAFLGQDPKRKFIWADISFFEWWWREQTPTFQRLTKQLLENGQLEFVSGGWVQPDEANTQLYAMEIQLQEGLDWIRNTFGEKYVPKYGWSIDAFGYSPTMAYLLKKYGFKGMLIQRVHYAVKKELAKNKNLEFNWRQVWDENGEHDIFCHVMPFSSYDVPHTCGPDPSVCRQFDFDFTQNKIAVTTVNVQERSMLLLDQYLKKASLYRSNVVLAPLGDDFRYQTTNEAYHQLASYQFMFDYINNNVIGVEIQFGTLSEYFEAVMGKFDPPLLKGSFFTYSDVNEDYWSGYFTSRPFDKSLDRLLERSLFAATSLGATPTEMQGPRRVLSLFQHHDAITGTAKDFVVEDYANQLSNAIHTTQDWVGQRILQLKQIDPEGKDLLPCWRAKKPRGLQRNMCDPKDPVWVYNPLTSTQTCGNIEVGGHEVVQAHLPCEEPGPIPESKSGIEFDPTTGLMTHPIREEWMTWTEDKSGGAYLFAPDRLSPYEATRIQRKNEGYSISSSDERGIWKRRVIERKVPSEFGFASVIDFVYETDLKSPNQEWFVRFTGSIDNKGVFHTDLNGFNFDTHYFRKDMPLQSQVFPMPNLASIEDTNSRMTILTNHAHGTASLQNGSIDVYLDRRITTDDARGLAQGVTDNVPTRATLRLVLEPKLNGDDEEFQPTPLCSHMLEQLNHPLEIYGLSDNVAEKDTQPLKPDVVNRLWDALPNPFQKADSPGENHPVGEQKTVVPFVFMVYKRVDFFKKAIASLLKSDFPREEVPLIVSHDGHFEDFTAYVQTLKDQGFKVIQLFHPYSCSDHPNTFPGDDPKLNEGYKGDFYGNPRTAWVTCCKHHFTWLMKTVYEIDLGALKADNFLFMEEDYVVAPTVYSSIKAGLHLIERGDPQPPNGFFGLVLDTSDGFTKPYDEHAREIWLARRFVTGPMVLPRKMFEKIRDNAKEYCTFDDYNWDWSLVHMQGIGMIPHTVLVPSRPQVLHIGFEGGMHEKDIKPQVRAAFIRSKGIAPEFYGTEIGGSVIAKLKAHKKGYGGWGHPADHQHCLELLAR